MKKLNNFLEWFNLTSAALFAVLYGTLQNSLSSFISGALSVLIGIVALIIVLRITEAIVQRLIDISPTARSLILGNDFIEGYWLDHSIALSGKVTKVGCIYIGYDEQALTLSGVTLDLETLRVESFDAGFTHYEKRNLFYSFEAEVPFGTTSDRENHSQGQVLGYAKLKFIGGSAQPILYSGHLFNVGGEGMITIQGERILDKSTVKRIENLDEKVRQLQIYSQKVSASPLVLKA